MLSSVTAVVPQAEITRLPLQNALPRRSATLAKVQINELVRRTGRIDKMAGASQLIQIELSPPLRVPKPQWLRAKAPVGDNFHNLKKLARGLGLHTVCESAQCPNIGECWNHKTATFMLLGDICTRRCGFCAVPKGRPEPIDWAEPRRVAEAVATLGLKHAVVTSVNRDDDNVGGARVFADTIREIRELTPDCRIEVLIPDFQGLEECLRIVLDARPDVLNHNTETVPRLYRVARSGARYERTLKLLEDAKKISPGMVTKSGVMVGLGESSEELIEVFHDLGMRGVDILTIGQYLRPSKDHLPIARYYQPEEFTYLRDQALRFGFRHVESGPLVRSSYHAHEQADATASPRAVF
jgi:lipoic acid synthetase